MPVGIAATVHSDLDRVLRFIRFHYQGPSKFRIRKRHAMILSGASTIHPRTKEHDNDKDRKMLIHFASQLVDRKKS